MHTKTNDRICLLRLEVLRFDSADVIATSAWEPPLPLDSYEMIGDPTATNSANPLNPTFGGYQEPTSGQ